jgi:hypothetical protein
MRSDVDAAVARLADEQYGVWTFKQAERRGANRALASRRTLSGRWIGRYPDIYTFPAWVSTFHGEALAAAWSLREGVTSRDAAAYLHGVDGAKSCPTEVTVPRGAHQPRPFRVREVRWLPASDTTVVAKVPCTTLARTLVELPEVWPERRVSDAWDWAIDSHRVSVARLGDTALPLAGRGHPSTALLRQLLERRDDGEPPPESELERVLYELIEQGGYGSFTRLLPLHELCALKGRVDGYLPQVRVVVEADGRRWHTRVLDFERDHARDNELQANGVFVARFSYRLLMENRDEALRVLDQHFSRNAFVRSRTGLWLPPPATG